MLGAGQQARAHLVAHDHLQDLETVRVYSPTPESRETYAGEMSDQLNLDVEAVDEPSAVFDGADIVQTATNAGEPVFEREWIEPGTHVGVIRSQETPETLFDPDGLHAFVPSWSRITQLEELGNQVNERSQRKTSTTTSSRASERRRSFRP